MKIDQKYGLKDMNEMRSIRDFYKHLDYMLLHYLYIKRRAFATGGSYPSVNYALVNKLIGRGLLRVERKATSETYHLTDSGIKFINNLEWQIKWNNIL